LVFLKFFKECDQLDIFNDLNRCANGEIVQSREILYIYRTIDEKKHLFVSYSFIPPDLVFVHADDITEQKESEEKYRNLINNINDILIEVDLDGKITFANPQISDILGYQQEEIIGLTTSDLIHPDEKLFEKK